MSCSAEGVTVDGGSVADFYGLYDLNQDYAGTFARFKATNCNGANARVAFIDGWETDVEIESMGAYGTTPIEFGTHSLTCRVRVGQLVGSSTADRMHNPWHYVLNNGNANNRAENLYDDISFRRLEDDEAMQLGVTDATVLLITVWSNSSGHEQFQGWARTSSSPDMEAFFLGGSVVTGTSALSTGGSSGTDGKLNIAAVEGAIHVKNRMGDARNVGIEIRTVF
jgi:hypothetical protein